MGQNHLRRSIYKNLYRYLERKSIAPEGILSKTNAGLENLIQEYANVRNSKVRNHLFFIILPAISVFRAFLGMDPSREKAVDLLKGYTFSYYKKTAALYGAFGKLPWFYTLFRGVFPYAMRSYPADGWDIEWLDTGRDEISFNMHSCLYYDTFKKYGCSELAPVFCGVDNLIYDNMSEKVKFARTKTIGKGDDLCDFRFIHM